jgi:glycosyltransferase involved in cell wall biosynthesis
LPNSPKVSVVVPIFNSERTLTRAIDSVLAQTLSDWEIILVDDGSTDGTADLIAQTKLDRVTHIRHPQNRGAAAARNSGIAAARGRWIAFLDSDDVWKPDKLERQIAALERHGDQNVMGCATGYSLHKNGRDLTVSLRMAANQFRHQILYGCTISPGTTLLVERSVFDEIGMFNPALRKLEDWDWLLRFAERYELLFVPDVLAEIYATKRGPTQKEFNLVADAVALIRTKHLSHYPILPKLKLQSSLFVEMGAVEYRRGKLFPAIVYVFAAIATYPFRNMAFYRTLGHSVRAALFSRRRPDFGMPVLGSETPRNAVTIFQKVFGVLGIM